VTEKVFVGFPGLASRAAITEEATKERPLGRKRPWAKQALGYIKEQVQCYLVERKSATQATGMTGRKTVEGEKVCG
jgi:hypothetical protein